MSSNVPDDNPSVTPVTIDGKPVGHVFGVGHSFYFLLDDHLAVDPPRGRYETADDAAFACECQARCLILAERWDDHRLMMVDT